MKQALKDFCTTLYLCCCLGLLTGAAHGDAGLIVETPTGLLGFLSDVGHSSVWISHGCLSARGEVQYCEHSQGIVLSSTAYWPNPGAAAIPADLFFLGSQPGPAGRGLAAWDDTLAAAYPQVKPAYGRKYLGRVWRRGMRVTTFATTPDEDRRVLAQVEQQRLLYRYSYSHRNCAFYAQQVLQLYLGQSFHANRIVDAGVYTPRALERALLHRLRANPDAVFRTLTFPGTLLQSWRQPPRNFCESALFDPKYAVPLLLFQPYLYAGFGACYGITRLTQATWHREQRSTALRMTLMGPASAGTDNPRLFLYKELTGELPTSPGWQQSLSSAESALQVPRNTDEISAGAQSREQVEAEQNTGFASSTVMPNR